MARKLKLDRGLGTLLLSVWLVLTGLSSLIGFHFNGMGVILGILAIAAGVLLFISR